MSDSRNVELESELLAFVLVSYPDVARSRVQKWLKHGTVLVNGQSMTRFNHRLQPGDVVSIRGMAGARQASQLPSGMTVLFEDESLIVIEKPGNLLTIATDSEREKTAHAYLTSYLRRGAAQRPERVWIVHRLDRETSGLMVFAKTETAKSTLQAGWHRNEKRYLAVVDGAPSLESGVLRSHLDESNPFKVFSAPSSEKTRLAVTHYKVLRRTATRSLIELTLETGRRNQIRVHLADAGCAIVGDAKYDSQSNPVRRLGLHASYLRFEHPVSNEPLEFTSELPESLARLV